MENEMETLLREAVGKAVRTNFAGNTAKAYESLYFNSLRESGLLRLLEASEKLREWSYSVTSYTDNVPHVNGTYDSNVEQVQDEYDAAIAAMKEKAHG